MDPNFILAHHRANEGMAASASANQFLKQQRPLPEVLHLIDEAIVGLHDAKAELVKFRETIHLQHRDDSAKCQTVSDQNPGGV